MGVEFSYTENEGDQMSATTAAATRTTCKRCGRTLTSAASIAAGRGKTCQRKAVVEADYSARQLDDALELIELGGVVPLRGRRVFLTVGSHGETYRTAATGQCDCPAGLKGRRCYHGLAVALVVGATPRPQSVFAMPTAYAVAA